jgi:hypothetical protein
MCHYYSSYCDNDVTLVYECSNLTLLHIAFYAYFALTIILPFSARWGVDRHDQTPTLLPR